jgi:hypothetical protein
MEAASVPGPWSAVERLTILVVILNHFFLLAVLVLRALPYVLM